MIPVDKNEFFRQATIRICGSLDLEKSLKDCYVFVKEYMPVTQIYLYLFDPISHTIVAVASAPKLTDNSPFDRVVLPETIRETFIKEWKKQEGVLIINEPMQEKFTEKLAENWQDTAYRR